MSRRLSNYQLLSHFLSTFGCLTYYENRENMFSGEGVWPQWRCDFCSCVGVAHTKRDHVSCYRYLCRHSFVCRLSCNVTESLPRISDFTSWTYRCPTFIMHALYIDHRFWSPSLEFISKWFVVLTNASDFFFFFYFVRFRATEHEARNSHFVRCNR